MCGRIRFRVACALGAGEPGVPAVARGCVFRHAGRLRQDGSRCRRRGLQHRRDGFERRSREPRGRWNSCALWRIRAVATRNRRLSRECLMHVGSAPAAAAVVAACNAHATAPLAPPLLRRARTNRIKRGIFCAARIVRRRRRAIVGTHVAVVARAPTARWRRWPRAPGNFFLRQVVDS